MKVKSESEVTLHDPMDCSLPGSSIHGIFQARVMKWVAIAFSNRQADGYKKKKKKKTHIYAVYKKPTSDLKTHID